MSEMVTRVARVICKWESADVDPDADVEGAPAWFLYEGAARAVLKALREPTEAIMVVIEQRAEREGDERYTAGHGDYERRFSPRKLIAAYIDSILQD